MVVRVCLSSNQLDAWKQIHLWNADILCFCNFFLLQRTFYKEKKKKFGIASSHKCFNYIENAIEMPLTQYSCFCKNNCIMLQFCKNILWFLFSFLFLFLFLRKLLEMLIVWAIISMWLLCISSCKCHSQWITVFNIIFDPNLFRLLLLLLLFNIIVHLFTLYNVLFRKINQIDFKSNSMWLLRVLFISARLLGIFLNSYNWNFYENWFWFREFW